MTGEEIITAARALIGTPFVHQGRTLRGLDCVGLLLYIAAGFGVACSDVAGYPRRPGGGLLEQTFDDHVSGGQLLRIDPADKQAGDFLMMRFLGQPQHVAIYTGKNIIHSYEAVGKVCEHVLNRSWAARIVRVYRLAGVES